MTIERQFIFVKIRRRQLQQRAYWTHLRPGIADASMIFYLLLNE